MGRRDAVQATLELVARCRQLLPSLIVTYEPGWERRGNGTSPNYDYGTVHHTASASSLARPFPTQTVLRDGRPGLTGPLCNSAGPACTTDAPRLHIMSANPANHAGASRASGPVPALSLFNPRTWGHEIDYAGSVAMMAGQLLVAHVLARAIADVFGGGNIEVVRAHQETSITGKWDPGYAPGKTINMTEFRATARTISAGGTSDMSQAEVDQIIRHIEAGVVVRLEQIMAKVGRPFLGFRNDPEQWEADGNKGDGSMVMAAPGYWLPVPGVPYVPLYQAQGLVGAFTNVAPNVFRHFRDVFLAPVSGKVDSGQLAKELAAALPEHEAAQVAVDLAKQAKAVADEIDARTRARLGIAAQ